MFASLAEARAAELHFKSDPHTGLRAIIAIHSTRRGPALGGCRILSYPSTEAAVADALRLARGMSYKAAMADLPLGGGKAVILQPEGAFDRRALFESFGQFVEDLNGRYITAVDSGSSTADMDCIACRTRHVTSTSQGGDPSPHTALGVLEGIRAAVAFRFRQQDLRGLHVALQGLGHVGAELARLLHAAGARLTVSDLDPAKVQHCETQYGAHSVAPEQIYRQPCEVFAPCGLGAILNDHTIDQLQCAIVAGSANNQLAEEHHGQLLYERGILYAPDYIINAGGLMFVALQHQGYDNTRIDRQLRKIHQRLSQVFALAAEQREPCNVVANRLAEQIVYAD